MWCAKFSVIASGCMIATAALLAGCQRPLQPAVEASATVPPNPAGAVHAPTADDIDDAVKHFRALGGTVNFDPARSRSSPVEVNCARTNVTDTDLAYLSGLSQLEVLVLDNTGISDAGILHIRSLYSLHRLSLSGTKITDAGLAQLRFLDDLQELSLSQTVITDEGLKRLADLTKLRELAIDGANVTDDGEKTLKRTIPDLHVTRK